MDFNQNSVVQNGQRFKIIKIKRFLRLAFRSFTFLFVKRHLFTPINLQLICIHTVQFRKVNGRSIFEAIRRYPCVKISLQLKVIAIRSHQTCSSWKSNSCLSGWNCANFQMDNFASLWHRCETVEGHTQGNIPQIASRGNGREATSLKPEVQVKVE